MKLAIVDTQCANLASLQFALERLGFKSFISRQIKELEQADKLFLPGVGTAWKAMHNLNNFKLVSFLKETKKPLLGICLGMQILGEFSQELNQKTLGIIPFQTLQFKEQKDFSFPHMGWNNVKSSHSLFKGLNGAYFYFVHNYYANVSEYTIATCTYSQDFSAALAKENFYGVQFHPERSGEAGEVLLKNFVKM
ncbi:imidazole glycerol phosphate synthase subunit HisH [Campylobacter sp. MIT 21-1685]|uniref:imidazole glycerol phosphate synthase subunit HisH n=1 Tax=unclassified Campylobacter TaxID=2593542 RepID=UPI00224AC53D|nr:MULTISPECIES: imidazole glycerol phosphate synthase subunit HisH [unclassified Campylobacter]MCX2683537.1 imidazole glycerol phosphate synthase subunit HisH [Campylobacter sp. MIT 21-1684]MCX2751802.1 imidazole glycerol phosphate synthase subunit HisH [Campylobacter sp. MIT 21-1682]MCX2808021.1 imidazole glycerol phosphate synthase subunit HisH [Campylobacter sp. MIT 21-1685]